MSKAKLIEVVVVSTCRPERRPAAQSAFRRIRGCIPRGRFPERPTCRLLRTPPSGPRGFPCTALRSSPACIRRERRPTGRALGWSRFALRSGPCIRLCCSQPDRPGAPCSWSSRRWPRSIEPDGSTSVSCCGSSLDLVEPCFCSFFAAAFCFRSGLRTGSEPCLATGPPVSPVSPAAVWVGSSLPEDPQPASAIANAAAAKAKTIPIPLGRKSVIGAKCRRRQLKRCYSLAGWIALAAERPTSLGTGSAAPAALHWEKRPQSTSSPCASGAADCWELTGGRGWSARPRSSP
jgi:hypothetical protein